MEAGLLAIVVLGVGFGGWGAWFLARRFGLWPGLLLPGALAGITLAVSGAPLGHAEEAMGRGLEVMFLWLPLTAWTALAAALGLYQRWRAGAGGPK
ncbi:MAG: hypothetical protein ACKO1H_14910 [Tabrizicola sp.]